MTKQEMKKNKEDLKKMIDRITNKKALFVAVTFLNKVLPQLEKDGYID
ncbi:hypothetical protein UMC2_15801 [[Clostridium] sordellii]|nr:hypothetical protein [Paeniclostridium sordellii]CEK34624.1 hypothetical protein UMC2_15801 [[Clostridium] sordellii] [Paeniclostridium sordellii]